jgi:hypothetical protein
VQLEQIKQVALLLAQSKSKKVASLVVSKTRFVQKFLFPQTGHFNSCPFTATV